MNETHSSCELTDVAGQAVPGSRVLRFRPGFRWEGVPVADYKHPAAHWCGIARMSLIGESGESTRFHLRYFEIAPGGFSSFEKHTHEHAVVVLRGRGEVRLGERNESVGFGDTVYVAPGEAHQFRNVSADEPFGFLCIVDAQRDQPTSLQ